MPSKHTRQYDRTNLNNKHGEDRSVSRRNGYRAAPPSARSSGSGHTPVSQRRTREIKPGKQSRRNYGDSVFANVLRLLGVLCLLFLVMVLSITVIKDYKTLKMVNNGVESDLVMPDTSNVLQWFTADGLKISVRPSGTEPKIKFYTEVKDPSFKDAADYERCIKDAETKIEALKKSLNL